MIEVPKIQHVIRSKFKNRSHTPIFALSKLENPGVPLPRLSPASAAPSVCSPRDPLGLLVVRDELKL